MKRIYHPYLAWEDFQYGMWHVLDTAAESAMLPRAIEFTGNAALYGSYMDRVAAEWPIACEHNLTNDSLNQQAWIGHAAAALAIRCPEYITRHAWSYLTDAQRNAANARAQNAIDSWRRTHVSGVGQHALQF